MDRKIVLAAAVALALAFAFGVLAGHFSKGSDSEGSMLNRLVADSFKLEQDLVLQALADVDAKQIREYHKFLTKEPHIAALKRDQRLVEWIVDEWKDAGLDNVELATYDMYLSWPNQSHPNKIWLKDENGRVRFTSKHKEVEVREGDDHQDFVHAFNGYAPAGDIEVPISDIVYTHYTRVEDLQALEDIGISLEGKICLAR